MGAVAKDKGNGCVDDSRELRRQLARPPDACKAEYREIVEKHYASRWRILVKDRAR